MLSSVLLKGFKRLLWPDKVTTMSIYLGQARVLCQPFISVMLLTKENPLSFMFRVAGTLIKGNAVAIKNMSNH